MPRRKCGFNSRLVLLSKWSVTSCQRPVQTRISFSSLATDNWQPATLLAVGPVLVSGGRLLSVMSQVRFLPPQLIKKREFAHPATRGLADVHRFNF